jgi:hypothetical protein
MDETTLDIAMVVVLLLGLVGSTYYLEKLSKRRGPIGGSAMQIEIRPPGPITKTLIYIARGLVSVMVLTIFGGFIFHSMILFYIGGGCLILAYILTRVRLLARLSGK